MRYQLFMRFRFLSLVLGSFLMSFLALSAQNINVEDVLSIKKKKPLKISGSLSASTTYFTANPKQIGRQAFTYQLSGSLNLSFYEMLNIPISINLNNYGTNFSYPSLPNRLSLHPSYKWIKTHIGDISMSFSPYTLNGHQFTGFGIDLTPNKWQFSAMVGRLKRRVDFDPEHSNILPCYERWGYGVKTRYNGDKFFLGGTMFSAKDKTTDLSFEADKRGIYPKQNVAFSIEAGISLIKNLKLSVEYALSVLTRDTRLPKVDDPNVIDKVLNRRTSTHTYYALKADLTYTFLGNNIGIGYERISPDYETLGAYYFNNDYENVTLNYSRNFFDDKLSLSASGGLQRDDLDNEKTERNRQLVGSLDITYTPNERLNTSLSMSSFQGFRNIKSSFDYINEQTPYQNLDTLNFTQLSNSIDLNLNYNTVKTEAQNHNLMLSLGYQEAADRQGDYILPGNLTRFLNFNSSYGINFIPKNFSLNLGFNASNNYSSSKNVLTLGPLISMTQRLLKKQMQIALTLSYNKTLEEGRSLLDIYNLRLNSTYRFLKRHSVRTSLAYQHRNGELYPRNSSFTAQLSYGFTF